MRRIGWFLAGAAVTAAAVAAVPALRERLRGGHDDLPPAVGLEEVLEADDETAVMERLPATPYTDHEADELRERIDSGRERLRQKARGEAPAGPEEEAPAEAEDEPPPAG